MWSKGSQWSLQADRTPTIAAPFLGTKHGMPPGENLKTGQRSLKESARILLRMLKIFCIE
jgi:hypothetical protein